MIIQETQRGRGHWKYNSSLGSDQTYVTAIQDNFDTWLNQYKI